MGRAVVVAALLALLCFPVHADDESTRFDQANKLYEQGKYTDAARAYDDLAKAGQVSVALYFNLGNAHFKASEFGWAIFNYRRAQLLAPRDPNVRANLRAARMAAKSRSTGPSPWLAWTRALSLNELTALTAAGFWIWLALLAAAQFRSDRRSSWRRPAVMAGVSSLLLALWLTAAWYDDVASRPAVVIAKEAVVRLGPFEESQSAFDLHDGAEVKISDIKADWLRIKDASGRVGWLRRDQVAALDT